VLNNQQNTKHERLPRVSTPYPDNQGGLEDYDQRYEEITMVREQYYDEAKQMKETGELGEKNRMALLLL